MFFKYFIIFKFVLYNSNFCGNMSEQQKNDQDILDDVPVEKEPVENECIVEEELGYIFRLAYFKYIQKILIKN